MFLGEGAPCRLLIRAETPKCVDRLHGVVVGHLVEADGRRCGCCRRQVLRVRRRSVIIRARAGVSGGGRRWHPWGGPPVLWEHSAKRVQTSLRVARRAENPPSKELVALGAPEHDLQGGDPRREADA